MKLTIIKLTDEFDTVVRTLPYRGHEIRIESWRTLGFRQERKSAEIRWADGRTTRLSIQNTGAGFSLWESNAVILKDARALIRDQSKGTLIP